MNEQINSAFAFLQKNEPNMTPGQISFTGSLCKWYKKKKGLSNTQALILLEIANNVKKKCNE